MGAEMLLDPAEIGAVLGQLTKLLAQTGNAFSDIPDHFMLGKIDIVDHGRAEIDVDHLFAAVLHEEWRLFDHVVTDVDYQVGPVDGAVNVIVA